MTDSFFLVVFALHERLSRLVIEPFLSGRIVDHMVDAPGALVHAAAAEARHDFLVLNCDLEYVVNRDVGVDDSLSLGDCARESVKQETVSTVVLADTLLDQRNDQIV